ncbi:lytic transglycosylase domain-containing protein [Roseovarius sp. SCSIO 43702]|uniref:lytic transglycosylase domain-containing protein n=1 Tax=Roseovarius sp. SCSIO 43702 TaxID=2823043 RepID=UPI001C72A09D|nr:lytic transglycosylase domain-containing protein [Roseovarius sp. SCSIO 43702]QYX56169.1 lytic transglycosylase domain-containing protein [Roseovarius sp. SCSIO 43702]
MQVVKRAILGVFIGCVVSGAAFAQSLADMPPRPFSSALEAARGGRWDRAAALAARAGPAAETLIEWQRLRTGRADAAEVLDFLDARPHWPGLDGLKAAVESSFEDATDKQVLRFYRDYRPGTGAGALRLAEAQGNAGETGEAQAGIVLAWRTLDLSTKEHDLFLAQYGDLLKPHHEARLDMAQWRGLKDADLMRQLVGEEYRELADLRDEAKRGKPVSDADISALAERLRTDPLLAYRRFERALDRNDTDEAVALLVEQSRSESGLGVPDRWASWRRILARRLLRDGDAALAYELSAVHGLTGGGSFADLEWLAGYIALRHLDDAELARDHFQRLSAAVRSPISRGRAGYWIGRAQEALGDAEGAEIAYAEAAEHATSFYGILAAERAGLPLPESLGETGTAGDWRDADFAASDVFQAGQLLLKAGENWQAEQFFTHLAEGMERDDVALLGRALEDMGEPHLQVMVGKRAAQDTVVAEATYYALHPMTELDLPINMDMALAIARRESEFDPFVRSGAGAEGLMQLMPGTGRDVARDTGVAYDRIKVRTDWAYNAKLGSAYLAQMAERFGGNVVLVSVAYNAGPHRAERWIEEYGDPRAPGVDVVDWIEQIPFSETRNYVQRVTESLPVYRARLGRDPLPIPFTEELKGKTLKSGLKGID